MKYIDLHQDIALSFADDASRFFARNSPKSSIFDAGGYAAYPSYDLVFGAIRPYNVQGDMLDKSNQIITFDRSKIDELCDIYNAWKSDVPFVLELSDLEKKGFKLLLHIEGFDGCTLEDIRKVYDMGIRSLGYVRNFDNNWAMCNTSYLDTGLTKTGYAGLELMQELGIMIDAAHMNHQSMMDVIGYVHNPIINSHSNAYEVYAHPRNVQDERLRLLPENGGVIGVNIYESFLGDEDVSIAMWIAHITHMRNIVGDEHICFGSDFHGLPTNKLVGGIDSVAEIDVYVDAVTKHFGQRFAEKFFYENAKRVVTQVL